eukprot:gene3214-2196_t
MSNLLQEPNAQVALHTFLILAVTNSLIQKATTVSSTPTIKHISPELQHRKYKLHQILSVSYAMNVSTPAHHQFYRVHQHPYIFSQHHQQLKVTNSAIMCPTYHNQHAITTHPYPTTTQLSASNHNPNTCRSNPRNQYGNAQITPHHCNNQLACIKYNTTTKIQTPRIIPNSNFTECIWPPITPKPVSNHTLTITTNTQASVQPTHTPTNLNLKSINHHKHHIHITYPTPTHPMHLSTTNPSVHFKNHKQSSHHNLAFLKLHTITTLTTWLQPQPNVTQNFIASLDFYKQLNAQGHTNMNHVTPNHHNPSVSPIHNDQLIPELPPNFTLETHQSCQSIIQQPSFRSTRTTHNHMHHKHFKRSNETDLSKQLFGCLRNLKSQTQKFGTQTP